MPDRYFSDSPITSPQVTLAGPEAHHLLHVMRAKVGTAVTLFDGSGCEFDAVVQRCGRAEVEFSVGPGRAVDRELSVELTLAVALPKGDRQKWLIEKAVELGVGRLVPIETRRGVAQPAEGALERLRRTVIEASKQCRRNRLMAIDAPRGWTELLAATADVPLRWLAHPCERRQSLPEPVTAGRIVAAIGPEGGFTDEEVADALSSGWQPIDLGPRILRVETAAILVAGLIADACQCATGSPQGR